MLPSGTPIEFERDAHEPISGFEPPRTRWQKFRLVVKIVELRLRFIALMAATGLVFAYWDNIWNRYDKWMRPAAESRSTATAIEHYCLMGVTARLGKNCTLSLDRGRK